MPTVDLGQNYTFRYSYTFWFEENFDYPSFYQWMERNWHYSFHIVALYLSLVFVGRQFMDSRPRFDLKWPLFVWNLSLASFSLFGAIRLLSELNYSLTNFGFMYTICDNSCKNINNPAAFWVSMFVLSKVIELGDTAFIVLRKQKLMFLHWFHHITVLLDAWYSVPQENAANRYFVSINISVHTMMYSYYVFKALKFKIPRVVAMVITFLQLLQMVVGLYINFLSYIVLKKGLPCAATMENIFYSTLMYLSYLILFSQFFYESYFGKPPGAKDGKGSIMNGHIYINSRQTQKKIAKKIN